MDTLQQQNEKITEFKQIISRRTCTVKELADALEISEAKARQLVRIEDFPKIKFGRNVRVILDKLDPWLDEHIGQCM